MASKIRRISLWLAAGVAVLGLGALAWARWPVPPSGRMVDVGGFRLHLVCEGAGSPAVILDSGSGDSWLSWFRVQPEIARTTRVCSFDRAGIGYSDPGPQPRSRRRSVEELRTLLARAGIPPPYVLVGHSFGGLDVRLLAALHSEEVTGVVLVESAHEDHWAHAPREFWQNHQEAMKEDRLLAEKAERGEPMPPISSIPGLPWKARRQLAAVSRRPAWYRASFEESEIAEASPREFAGLPRQLDVPLIVLSAGSRQRPPSRPLELHQRWVRIAGELQADLASRSPCSRHITVPDAGHFIHWDRPKAVTSAIEALLDDLRHNTACARRSRLSPP
ncbi:MAG TPA: alpha/beta hydrolase [Thermoanaerobaculia bacterium]|nr:alpha/beta hydrolase [Thermoanaerobaculia bacterium]